MKKLFQDVSNGNTIIEELPRPQCKKGHVLIKTSKSLISAGTERMLVDFGKANYFDKARQQPEKVKMVLDKVKTDGIVQTMDAVKSKLDQPLPMGYSNVGIVEEVASDVTEFKIGDRVVSNGSHAEMVCVPKNLVAKIPKNVADEDAAFTVVSSIALQGIRLINPTIGENIVVMGLGLIGLISIQILKANGCKVLGMDFDQEKIEIAKNLGVDTVKLDNGVDSINIAKSFSNNIGIDGVLITAATKSNDPVHNAAQMCRQKGRIVLVGVVGLDLQRNDFYEKELSFSVSCSYGPGRYDKSYEEDGNDYPIGYVRWTEKRNFESILYMIEKNTIDFNLLKTDIFKFTDAANAYKSLIDNSSTLGIILDYDSESVNNENIIEVYPFQQIKAKNEKNIVIGVIGAGNHAGRTLLPAFKKTQSRLKTISSSQGFTSGHYAKKLGFQNNTTDYKNILKDDEINTLIIATQHDTHSKFVCEGLLSQKNVFVEKPLALDNYQLEEIKKIYLESLDPSKLPILMVGFNRRFSPLTVKAKESLAKNIPIAISYTCNAGYIPKDSWVHDPKKGGGRILGEACHFIDLCRFFTGSKITSIHAESIKEANSNNDTAIICLGFEDGSIASINYFSNGNPSFPKEKIDIFQGGKSISINNFIELKSYGFKNTSNRRLFKQNKGQIECVKSFTDSINLGLASPIDIEEIFEVSEFAIKASKFITK